MSDLWFNAYFRLRKKHINLYKLSEGQRARITRYKIGTRAMNEQIRTISAERDELKRDLGKLLRKINGCRKVRFVTEGEAKAYADYLTDKEQVGYIPYECIRCNPNELTDRLYWHITHEDEQLRGLHK